MSKPTIVFVPGAWHQPAHYDLLFTELKNAGYTISTAPNPSANPSDPHSQSIAKDAASIRENLILPQLEAGKDVVVVGHSYGGCPASVAAKGLDKETTKGNGVIGLVLIAAFVAPEGASLKTSLPGNKYDDWVHHDESTGLLHATLPPGPAAVFYNDLPASHPQLQNALSLIVPQSEASLSSPSPAPAWLDAAFNGRRAYIKCTLDACIPKVAQDAMVQYSGVEWAVEELETGHSPFLSKPKELAGVIGKFVGRWSE